MDALREIVREDEGRVGQRALADHRDGADPATIAPALPDARRDQSTSDDPSRPVASSPYSVALRRRRGGRSMVDDQLKPAAPHIDPALPEGRLVLEGDEHHPSIDEAATHSDPGDAGRVSDHSCIDTRFHGVALATVPPQGGAGEGQRSHDAQCANASPAKVRKARAVRGAVDQSRVATARRPVDSATPAPAQPDGEIDPLPGVTRAGIVDLTTPIGGDAEDLARQSAPETRDTSAGEVAFLEIVQKGEGRVGRHVVDNHCPDADAAAPIPGDGEGGVGHTSHDIRRRVADPATIGLIRELWRRRQAWHRAEKGLTLQAKAMCRGLAVDGDKAEAGVIYDAALGKGDHTKAALALVLIGPIVGGRRVIEAERVAVEMHLAKLAKTLPVAPFILATRGVGIASLAAIVGEAGDLSGYANPAKLWKRMGLAVMPDGTRQRRVGGDEALAHGYAPARRSVVWNIGGGLIGGMGRGPRLEPGEDPDARDDLSPLQRVFVRRLRYEAERDPSHARPVTKAGKESFSAHAANRAKRYVEKRFLLLLWRAWRHPEEIAR